LSQKSRTFAYRCNGKDTLNIHTSHMHYRHSDSQMKNNKQPRK